MFNDGAANLRNGACSRPNKGGTNLDRFNPDEGWFGARHSFTRPPLSPSPRPDLAFLPRLASLVCQRMVIGARHHHVLPAVTSSPPQAQYRILLAGFMTAMQTGHGDIAADASCPTRGPIRCSGVGPVTQHVFGEGALHVLVAAGITRTPCSPLLTCSKPKD